MSRCAMRHAQWLADGWKAHIFGYTGSVAWNTPKKAKTHTPTAREGCESGQKRQADFESDWAEASRYAPKMLTYF